jgi:hypothetical protein
MVRKKEQQTEYNRSRWEEEEVRAVTRRWEGEVEEECDWKEPVKEDEEEEEEEKEETARRKRKFLLCIVAIG